MILKYEDLTFLMSNTISIVNEQDLKGAIEAKLYIGVNLEILSLSFAKDLIAS